MYTDTRAIQEEQYQKYSWYCGGIYPEPIAEFRTAHLNYWCFMVISHLQNRTLEIMVLKQRRILHEISLFSIIVLTLLLKIENVDY